MYNNPFFIPIYPPSTMTAPNLIRSFPTSTIASTSKNAGLFTKLGSGISGIKKINWGGLINNTSKTLGIINQTIPIVKQVGPVMNNMKSMIRVASLFKDETDIRRKPINNNNNYITTQNPHPKTTQIQKTNYNTNNKEYTESPTFFINT